VSFFLRIVGPSSPHDIDYFFYLLFIYEGLMVMPRTPIASSSDDDYSINEGSAVDASLLPPG
jgi:hypothetical protein